MLGGDDAVSLQRLSFFLGMAIQLYRSRTCPWTPRFTHSPRSIPTLSLIPRDGGELDREVGGHRQGQGQHGQPVPPDDVHGALVRVPQEEQVGRVHGQKDACRVWGRADDA